MFPNKKRKHPAAKQESKDAESQVLLDQEYESNLNMIQALYANCSDVVFRSFQIGGTCNATLVYIEGITDTEKMDKHVLAPLMQEEVKGVTDMQRVGENLLSVSKFQEVKTLEECVDAISSGGSLLLIDGQPYGLALGLTKWEKRSIEEPTGETGVRGPREGFTETLSVSTSQLRRIIKSPALKMESMTIGSYTRTSVMITYIEGVAEASLLDEVRDRLRRIEIDGILESGYIEELIEDNPFSPFPQLKNTERPDVVCADLLEGRVAILMEGTPFALVAPVTFWSLMQSQEDYYQRYYNGTVTRWLRYFFLLFSLLLPSIYVAVVTFHQEMVPTSLLMSMAASREAVPFPALIEALLMEVTFEALREAGIRMPKQLGAAVSIVGALVIGQAAVQAGIISAPMVIVVAITGVASFMMPRYAIGISIRILRFPVMLLAGTLGLLGVILAFIVIVVHLCALRSFGVPYMSPLGPFKRRELKDSLLRAHWLMMDARNQREK